MDKVGGIIVAAGRGDRMGSPFNKVYLPLGEDAVLMHSLRVFEDAELLNSYVVVASKRDLSFCRTLLNSYPLTKLVGVVEGGETRQDSVVAGLNALPKDHGLVVVHDGARPLLSKSILEGAIRQGAVHGAVVVAVPAKDTVKLVEEETITDTPERSSIWLAQTPQVFHSSLLIKAIKRAEEDGYLGTDDASLVERLGHQVKIYPGTYENIKITTPEDLVTARALLGIGEEESLQQRTGLGYDVHPFCHGKPLYLAGVQIPESPGLAGHSDGDVALHSLTDACLGAAGLGDIGLHFPPSDPGWKDASSLALLSIARRVLAKKGFRVMQGDLVIACEKPRLAPYIGKMREQIAAVLGIPGSDIGIKATTTEGLGFVGRSEGIACWAVATVQKTAF